MKENENIIQFFLYLDMYLREGFTASYALERATYDYQKEYVVTGKRVSTGAVDPPKDKFAKFEDVLYVPKTFTVTPAEFCSNCGMRFREGHSFCVKCGSSRGDFEQ